MEERSRNGKDRKIKEGKDRAIIEHDGMEGRIKDGEYRKAKNERREGYNGSGRVRRKEEQCEMW